MGRKRYYFPYVARRHPMFHVAVTSKTLIERAGEVDNVFQKYSENSNIQSPRQILYLMSRQNESILELSESESDRTSPKIKSSQESSSPEKRNPSFSSLKQKHLSCGDTAKSGSLETGSFSGHQTVFFSPPKKGSSTMSKATDLVPTTSSMSKATDLVPTSSSMSKTTDLVPTSHVQPQEITSTETSSLATAVRKLVSPIKKSEMDTNPTTCVQEYVSPSDKAEMANKTDSGSPAKEFKIPVLPVKDGKKVSKPAKRPRLFDSSLGSIPEFVSPSKKAKTRFHLAEDDEMDTSPNKGDKMSDSPSKYCNVSPDKSESPKKIESPFSSMPIMKDDGIEIDLSSKSEETPGPSCTVSSAEIESLVDDPSRVDSIRKAVEDRLKVRISPKKPKEYFSLSEKKSSNRSPRKSKKINSPGKDIKNTSREGLEIKSPSILSNPNVIAYIKLRFKSVLSHRNKYMFQIHNFLEEFEGDVRFLYSYSQNVLLAVQDIPIEGKVYCTRDLRNLKRKLIRNATELCNNLRPISDTVKSDITFWVQDIREIRKLNEKNELLLSAESGSLTSVEFLREYESNLRIIWERMDRKVLLGDRLRLSLLEISADFVKLTKDFVKYLTMVELMKPSSLASSEGEKRRLRISWF